MFGNRKSARQFAQSFGGGDSFDLRPVDARMAVAWMEQRLVQALFIAQEEESFAVSIQAPQRINARRDAEFSQGAVARAIRGES